MLQTTDVPTLFFELFLCGGGLQKPATPKLPSTFLSQSADVKSTLSNLQHVQKCHKNLKLTKIQVGKYRIYTKMQSGNINRDRTSFSYRQNGVRKTHKLNTNDLFLTSSISGDEVVVQRKGHPTQFLHIDGVDLKKFLERNVGRSASSCVCCTLLCE